MAGRHALARVENLSRSGRVALWSRKKFDPIGESSQFADHLAGAHLLRLCADGGQPFLVAHALVKNLPNQATEPVGDRIDGLGVAEPRDEPSIHNREDGALRLHCGVGGLIQDASHLAVALGAAVTVILARALLGATSCGNRPEQPAKSLRRARTHEMSGERER